jgi:hypothetical protein
METVQCTEILSDNFNTVCTRTQDPRLLRLSHHDIKTDILEESLATKFKHGIFRQSPNNKGKE